MADQMTEKVDPQFLIGADCIETLSTPSEFYEALQAAISSSNDRLTLASLYLGTGAMEQALVDLIRRRLHESPTLRVHGQFDYSRCLRLARPDPSKPDSEIPSSADLLLRLFDPIHGAGVHGDRSTVTDRIKIGLTRMPAVRGWLSEWVPQRFVEAGGVWHVKAYVADAHTILLSGANLSSDYFTNRQDRYVLIQRTRDGDGVEEFASYLHGLISTVGSLPGSHVLVPTKTPSGLRACVCMLDEQHTPVRGEPDVTGPSGRGNVSRIVLTPPSPDREASLDASFASALSSTLPALSHSPDCEDLDPSSVPDGKCRVSPRLQCAAAGVRHDEVHTLAVLEDVRPAPADTLYLATGYFNVTEAISSSLIHSGGGQGAVHLLTAAPQANGFFGAHGPAGAIPLAYSEMEREFLERAEAAGRLMPDPVHRPAGAGIAMHEYSRPGWTFHGKGLWLERQTGEGGRKGMLTLVGSPNYGVRSAERDLEFQACFVSRDPGLVERWTRERDGLWGKARPEHGVGETHVRPVGRHLGPGLPSDVFSLPSRTVTGMTWAQGWWIHWGRRVLSRFF